MSGPTTKTLHIFFYKPLFQHVLFESALFPPSQLMHAGCLWLPSSSLLDTARLPTKPPRRDPTAGPGTKPCPSHPRPASRRTCIIRRPRSSGPVDPKLSSSSPRAALLVRHNLKLRRRSQRQATEHQPPHHRHRLLQQTNTQVIPRQPRRAWSSTATSTTRTSVCQKRTTVPLRARLTCLRR